MKKKYKFKWTAYDWVDMYHNGENLWTAGLHSKFNGHDEDHHFNDIITFWSEIKRCIEKFRLSHNDN